jgi:hypothetical protein
MEIRHQQDNSECAKNDRFAWNDYHDQPERPQYY